MRDCSPRCAGRRGFLAVVFLCLLSGPGFGATLSGTVVDPQGQPVVAAQVWLCALLPSEDHQVGLLGRAETGPEGDFTVSDNERAVPPDRPYVWVVVHQPGRALGAANARVPTTRPLRLVLTSPLELSGQVLDEQGRPLAGARVTPYGFSPPDDDAYGFTPAYAYLPEALEGEFSVETAADGTFHLDCLGPSGSISLRLSAPGYGRVRVAVGYVAWPLRLTRAGRLRGQLVCPEQPELAAGRWVNLYRRPQTRAGVWPAVPTVLSDAEGNFLFPEVPAGDDYALSVRDMETPWQPPTQQPYAYSDREGLEIQAGRDTTTELRAEKTAPVKLRLVAADTGEPLAGVMVNPDSGGFLPGKTDEDGGLSARLLPGTMPRYWIVVEGYVGRNLPDELTVGPEGADLGDLQLEPACELAVTTVDEAGKPVVGAHIFAQAGEEYWRGGTMSQGTTDEQGRLTVTGLAAGAYTVCGRTGESASIETQVTLRARQPAPPVRLVLKVQPQARARVTILDQDGRPLPNVRVRLKESFPPNARPAIGHVSPRERVSDAQGEVIWRYLSPRNSYTAVASSHDCFPALSEVWQAVEGQEHDFGALRVTPLSGTVAGTVVDENGKPVGGALVFDSVDGAKRQETLTDDQGRFQLGALPTGDLLLFAQAEGKLMAHALVPAGETGARLVLEARPVAKLEAPEGEAPPLKTPVPPQARATALKLIREALALAHGDTGWSTVSVWQAWAALEPEAALAAAPEGQIRQRVQLRAGEKLLAVDFPRALEVLKQAPPGWGVSTLLEGAWRYRHSRPELARQCVEAALAELPSMTDWRVRYVPGYRARLGQVLVEIQDPRGPGLLEEAFDAALDLPVIGDVAIYSRGQVAAVYATVNVDDALALLAPVEAEREQDKRELQRALAAVAAAVAPRDPQKALEILARIPERSQREWYTNDLLWSFPADSLNVALATARAMTDLRSRATALVLLAQVTSREQVAALLEEAAQTCLDYSGPDFAYNADILGAIACVARRLGYSRWEEWSRLLGARSGDPDGPFGDTSDYQDFRSLKLLALSQPQLARHVLMARLRRLGGMDKLAGDSAVQVIGVAAAIDPDWAQELLAQIPADRKGRDGLVRVAATTALVRALPQTPEERERWVLNREVRGPWLLPTDEELPRY